MAFSAFGAAAAPASAPLHLAPAAITPPDEAAAGTRRKDAVDFAVVIPALLRLLQNDHPAELQALTGLHAAPIAAVQRIVLVSTLRSGFCMDLRLNPLSAVHAQVIDWQVQLAALSGAATASGARVEAFEGGWRVCARRAGRFELALQHAFSMQPRQTGTALATHAVSNGSSLGWPVALSLSTP